MHHRSGRTALLVTAVVLLSLMIAVAPAARADRSAAAVPIVHLEGRGHGHGVGMSQWGAYTLAQNGASVTDIIGAFYPGTQLANLGGEVVVVVDRRGRVRVQFPGGGEVRSARSGDQQPGFPVTVPPGGTVEVVRDRDGYRVTGGSVAALGAGDATPYSAASDCILVVCEPSPSPTTPPPPTTTTTTTTTPPSEGGDSGSGGADATPTTEQPAPATTQPRSDAVSSRPVWAVPASGSVVTSVDRGRSYRGSFEIDGPAGALQVRNHVDIEDYLKGMAEVPGDWPAAAVQAQAIAARTYALRAMAAGGELCDTDACQVYVGTARESAGQVAAVDATRGVVVTYGGRLAATYYSASAGGVTATVAEGFGTPYDLPYLQAHPTPTVHPDVWTLDIALTDVARRLGYRGALREVRIDRVGPSGRPLQMTLDGDAGPMRVDPQEFRRRLGLRSTLFTIAAAQADNAPPPPPDTVDPGVVGAGPDAVQTVRPEAARPDIAAVPARTWMVAAPPPDPSRPAPVGAVAAAAGLAAVAWVAVTRWALATGAITIGRKSLASLRAATMARWMNRFR